MERPLQNPLPFDHAILSRAVYDDMCRQTNDWANQWLSVNSFQKEFTFEYMKHCSPEGLSSGDVLLPAIYVMWFVAFNDIPNGLDRQHRLEEIQGIIETKQTEPKNNDAKLANATRRFFRQIYDCYNEDQIARLREFLRRLVQATLKETKYGDTLPSVESYLKIREHTIAGYPYIELFRLILIPRLSSEYSFAIERMEELCVQGLYLVNDLLSVQRDLRKNKLNLVRCISNEKHISLEESQERVLEKTHRTLDRLRQCYLALIEKEPDDRTKRYAAFLLTVQEGNRVSACELRERYFRNG